MLDPWSLEQASVWRVLKFRPVKIIPGGNYYTCRGLKTVPLPFLVNERLKKEKLINCNAATECCVKGNARPRAVTSTSSSQEW